MPFPGYYDPTATQVAADDIAYAGLSSKLWRDVPQSVLANNPGDGLFELWRPTKWAPLTSDTAANDQATLNILTGGQAVVPAANWTGAIGPVLDVDSEGTDNQGVEALQFTNMMVTATPGWDIIFEARVQLSDLANIPSTFVGLADAGGAVLKDDSGQTYAATDWAGFYQLESALTAKFAVEDGTLSETDSAVHTFVDAATADDGKDWVKLGFRLTGADSSGSPLGGEYYVNGVKGTQSVDFTVGPVGAIVPSFGCLASGAADAILHVHWFAIGQVPTIGR